MRRLFLVAVSVATISVPVSFVAVGLASPAGAASGVACKKLSGSLNGSGTFTVSKCTPKNKQDTKATGATASLATGSGSITWSPSHGTTSISATFTQSGTSCKKGSSEYVISGSVTGGTSTYTASGDAVSADVCVTNAGKFSLVKGTSMHL
jgi:hypothetical protein